MRVLRRFFTTLVASLLLLSLFGPLHAHAEPFPEDYPKMGDSGESIPGHSLIVGSSSFRTHLFPIHTQSGGQADVFAYCIEMEVATLYNIDLLSGPWSDFPGTNTFATDPVTRQKVAWIVRNSYPQTSLAQLENASGIPGLTAKEAIAGTQAAIWSLTEAAPDATGYTYHGVVVSGARHSPGTSEVADRVGSLVSYLTGSANSGRPETTGPALAVGATGGQAGTPVGPIRVESSEATASILIDAAYPLVTSAGTPVDLNAAPTNTDLFLDVPADAPAGSAEIRASITGPTSTGLLLYNTQPRTQTLMIALSDNATVEDSASLTWAAVPEIRTSASDGASGGSYLLPEAEARVVDVVTYERLIPGKEYTVFGELMIREADGTSTATGITAERSFTPSVEAGSIDLEFTVPEGMLGGTVLVVFEHLFLDGIEVAAHADISDESQTVYRPQIDTFAYELLTKGKILPAEGGTLRDEIYYSGLKIGETYTVRGEVMLHETGESTGIIAETTFTAETESGTVFVDFDVPEGYANRTLVVFERLFLAPQAAAPRAMSVMPMFAPSEFETLLATHEDLDDENQTTTVAAVPLISTTARDSVDSDSYLSPVGTVGVVDVVRYSGLTPGSEYTIAGELMIRNLRGEPEPTGITAELAFAPAEASGEVELEFIVPAGMLTGSVIVVFERLSLDGVEVAAHTDINDENQTVFRPRLETDAYNLHSPQADLPHTGGTLQDRVAYAGLKVGETYRVSGELIDRDTGEPTGVTGETSFTAESQDGVVFVDFTVTNEFGGRSLVVFERLFLGDLLLADHADLTDERQTVNVEVPPVTPTLPPTGVPPSHMPATGAGAHLGLLSVSVLAIGAGTAFLVRRFRF